MQLKSMMEAVNTEIRLCTEKNWESTLRTVLQEKGISQHLYGSKTTLAEKLWNISGTLTLCGNWLIIKSRLKKARTYCSGLTHQSQQPAAELQKQVL